MGRNSSVYLDGFDLSELGFVCETGIDGWRDSVRLAHDYLAIANKIARLRTTRLLQSELRTVSVRGGIDATSVSELRDARREIYYRWARARSLQFHDDPSIEWRVFPGGSVRETPVQPEIYQDAEVIQLPFDVPDPRAYDVGETSILGFSGPTAIPLGTAPVEVRIVTTELAATITKKDSGGNETGHLSFDASAFVGQGPWLIDMAKESIYTAGDWEIAADVILQDGGDFFSLDPILEGDVIEEEWPTLETSSGTLNVFYHKAWLG